MTERSGLSLSVPFIFTPGLGKEGNLLGRADKGSSNSRPLALKVVLLPIQNCSFRFSFIKNRSLHFLDGKNTQDCKQRYK